MISLLVEQTNLYATRDKNMQTFTTNDAEMRKFLGLLLISGYHNLPSEVDYWSTAEEPTSQPRTTGSSYLFT